MRAQVIILFLVSFLPFTTGVTKAQSLPAERSSDWKRSVAQCRIELPKKTINFLQAGGNNQGNGFNDSLMDALLSKVNPDSGLLIYFPAGTYRFKSDIRLPSHTVLQGVNASQTILKFNLGGSGNPIEITGKPKTNYLMLASDALRNEQRLQLRDSGIVQQGELLYLLDDDSTLVTSTWAFGSAGQMVKVDSVKGKTLFLSSALRRDFLLNKRAKILRITPVEHAGLEYLSIVREDATSGQTSNINMEYSTQCFVRCVESYNCNFAHVAISYSAFNTVKGSFFKDGFSYGSGGKAYGAAVQFASSDCYIYNNVFRKLRHSVLLQSGANGNVIGYNYSIEPYWTDVSLPSNSAGDLVLHGNYPYGNLFEGNIVQNIVIDNSHGINGPYNTFHRNRAELYGVFMNNGAGSSVNLIANEVTGTGFLQGMFTLTGSNHFVYGNNVKGTLYDAGTGNEADTSLYGAQPEEFYAKTNTAWPPIGTFSKFNTQNTSSKARYLVSAYTSCAFAFTQNLEPEFSVKQGRLNIHPNPCTSLLYLPECKTGDQIRIRDLMGRLISEYVLMDKPGIDVQQLPNGIYLVECWREGENLSARLVKGS
ncbi:MAG: hypothetical protein RL160_1199 [Bacteroidota bacterium]|jgi:hypothetical protein